MTLVVNGTPFEYGLYTMECGICKMLGEPPIQQFTRIGEWRPRDHLNLHDPKDILRFVMTNYTALPEPVSFGW